MLKLNQTMAARIFVFIILIAAGYYIYKTYWLDQIQVDFSVGADNISVIAIDHDYHDCKINTSGEYEGNITTLRAGQRQFLGIYDLKQWNGTQLQSIDVLERELRITISCNEGRYSKVVENRYSSQK